MKYRPLQNYLIVEMDQKEKKSEGGIHIPESANPQKNPVGIVLARGPGFADATGKYPTPTVKVGDRVLLTGRGMLIDYDGKECLLIRDTDAAAVEE